MITKENEEILLIIEQRKSHFANRVLNYTKTIISIIGAIVLFFWIQSPNAIINRKATQEEINRERAKLILALLENKGFENQAVGLKIIRLAYQGNDETSNWIDESVRELEKQSLEAMITKTDSKLRSLMLERNRYSRSLSTITDQNSTDYVTLNSKLELVKVNIELEKKRLNYYQDMFDSL